ncbi:MAG: branched-chain-amino-acid transaminase [Firmicutes bacterium]|nr:branched-chain-amino-acid transaminase [Bacillota bacterium]
MENTEKPTHIWFKGKICEWSEALIHVWSELATRGTNVFEGIRCYRQKNGKYAILSLKSHLLRLEQSARLLHISNPYTIERLIKGIKELIKIVGDGRHLYIRPTIFVDYGRYGNLYEDAVVDAYIVCLPVERDIAFQGIKCCISTFRRSDDSVMSPLIKAGASYHALRLPIIEAKSVGYDDAIMLNSNGYVSETTSAAIFCVKNNKLISPPLSSGILDSITRKHVIKLASINNIAFIERDITRMELYTFDEIFAVGTLCEIKPILQIDAHKIGNGNIGKITNIISKQYFGICDGTVEDKMGWLTYV